MKGLVGVRSGRIDVWQLLLTVAMLSVLIDNCVAASPAEICTAKKHKATGRNLYGKAKCQQRALLKPSFPTSECLARVEEKFTAAFARADADGGCDANNASTVEEAVDDCLASFTAAITGDAKCAAAKTKAIGRKAYDDLNCRRRAFLTGAPVDAQCLGKPQARFTSAIAKADGLGTCSDTAAALETLVDQCVSELDPIPLPCSSEAFPTCGGYCGPGRACTVFFFYSCTCVPSCLTSEAPTCGGTCPDGQLCGHSSGSDSCTCVPPDNTCTISEAPACGGTCPDGQVCGQVSGQGNCRCVTADNTCAISEAPACGGTCFTSSYSCQSQGGSSCACVCDSASPCPFAIKWGDYGSADGQFRAPRGIAVDASGDVYVADTENYRIQKFTSTGTFVTKWGSPGAGDGQFSRPSDVAVDAGGNVYVADLANDRIQKFTTTGHVGHIASNEGGRP